MKKRLLLVLSAVLIIVLVVQNRAVLLLPFIHNGMTQDEVTSLLGTNCRKGWPVKGLIGTGPAHLQWTYSIYFFGYVLGNFHIRFEGDDLMKMKTRKT
jgi:hypothetical protein